MKKIGVLFGQENTFPGAFVERVNSMAVEGITAEFVEVGGVEMAVPCGYAVIVDRISHDMPFYRAYLKNAVLSGTQVINNPFWWSADDKFFNYALASKLGVAVPRTALIPHKHFPPQINAQSCRNMQFPLDWDAIFDYVKFPAFLKPHDGGGWRDVYHVHSPHDFFQAYDQSRDLCMTLQAAVNFKEYFRCYVVGQSEVRIMAYDPRRPHHERYVLDPPRVPQGPDRTRGEGCADALPRVGLRPEHGRVRGRGWRAVRHRLHEPGAGRGRTFRRQGELRVDRRCGGAARGKEGAKPCDAGTALGRFVERNGRGEGTSQEGCV